MITLGINAVYHDDAACLVKDGVVIAAAEDERFTHVKHGKRPVPFELALVGRRGKILAIAYPSAFRAARVALARGAPGAVRMMDQIGTASDWTAHASLSGSNAKLRMLSSD